MKHPVYTFLFLLGLLFASNCSAQSWLWAKQPVFTGHPTNQSDGEAWAVATDNAGNVYETGFFAYATMQYGNFFLNTVNPTAFLVKYDATGNPLWATEGVVKTEYDESIANAIAVDGDGNVYITGFFADSVTFGNYILHTQFNGEVFLVKYNPNGVVLWAIQTQTNSFHSYPTQGLGVCCDKTGNVYVTGEFQNTLAFGTFQVTTPPTAGHYPPNAGDVFLAKCDSNGTVLWLKQGTVPSYNSSGFANAIAADNFNDVYITGSFRDTITFGTQTIISASKVADVFVAKYDQQGNFGWVARTTNSSTSYWSNGPIVGNSITTDNAGNAYVAGNFEDTISFGSVVLTSPINFDSFSFPYGDMFIAKYSPNGNVVWAQAGKPLADCSSVGWSITSDTFNHIYFLGCATSIQQPNFQLKFGADTFSLGNNPPAEEGSFVIEFDTSGNILCGAAMPMGGDDYGGIATDPSGKYVFMGQDYSTKYTVYIANDTINYPPVTGEELPFVARWSSCSVNLAPLAVSAGHDNASCSGVCNGQASANPSGGTPPYKYLWNTVHSDTTKTIAGLCAGSYTVTVTDSIHAIVSAVVIISDSLPPSPPAVTALDTLICSNDSTQVCAAGAFSSYTWNTGATGACIEVNNAGGYWVTASADNGCSVVSGHANISVYPVSSVSIIVRDDTLSSYNAVAYQWYLNDSAITGATSSLFIAHTAGSYTVQITDTNGCEAISNPVTITGINNLEQDKIAVYPNPSTGSWQLTAGAEWIGCQLNIYAPDGRLILNSIIKNTSTEINFEAPNGVYLLQIVSPSSNITYKLIRL